MARDKIISDALGIVLDKLLEDIVDDNCDGYNYELCIPAKHAIEQLIAESYKQGYIAGGIEILNASCELCNGYPMTADCNNGNCHTNKEYKRYER